MITNEQLLKKIKPLFNLNIYEVKIWTALLSKGVATAGELSDIGNVPRSRSYDVLESLEKKGFVIMKLGKPIRYIAVSPEEILKRTKEKIQKNANTQVKAIQDVKGTDLFNELNMLYKNGINHVDQASLAGSIKGRTNLHSHIDSTLKRAKKTAVIVTTETGLIRKAKKFKKTLKALSDKGVQIKVFAPLTEKNREAVSQLAEFATIKNSNGLNARMIIIDGKEAVFMLADDKDVHESYDTGIWVNTPYFAKTVEEMVSKV